MLFGRKKLADGVDILAWKFRFWCAFVGLCLAGCASESSHSVGHQGEWPENLSDYELFLGNGATQQPATGVMRYDVNTPLFSDYTAKYRVVKLPPGSSASYHDTETFSFPVGTIVAKTFACPEDRRNVRLGERLLETRILWHLPTGWVGLPYVWNEEQTEATLAIAGETKDVRWIHDDGIGRVNNYIIPNVNECKVCHKETGKMKPIGLKARHLNRDYVYPEGSENQLGRWQRLGLLQGISHLNLVPRLAVWDDPKTGTVVERARAWLEVNCAHCHNPRGTARNAGLDLSASQSSQTEYGVFKSPAAAGRGSGGRRYDIVPGQPDASILVYRIGSTESQVMMPELGKRMVHQEGVELVRKWIAQMSFSQDGRHH